MNNLAAIKANITASFTSNGVGDITGLVGRTQINDLVDKIYEDLYGLGYILKGVATTGTSPGALAEKAAYINTVSSADQTFTGLGNITVTSYKLGLFLWDTISWTFTLIASLSSVSPGAGDVVDDGGSSTISNIVIENDIDGKHIIDSGVPVPGIYKAGLVVGAYSRVFAADVQIHSASLIIASGAPTIKIGTAAGLDDISGGTFTIDSAGTQIPIARYTGAGETIYYTLGGTGTAYIRFDYTNKMYLP